MDEYIYPGVDELEAARRFERNLQCAAKESAHHAAMGDDDDLLALMSGRQFVEASHIALNLLHHAFATGNDIARPLAAHRPRSSGYFAMISSPLSPWKIPR